MVSGLYLLTPNTRGDDHLGSHHRGSRHPAFPRTRPIVQRFPQLSRRHLLPNARRWYIMMLLVAPAITAVITFLPESCHLSRYDFHLRTHGQPEVLTWTGGPWNKILHFYGYVITTLAFVILEKAASGAKRFPRCCCYQESDCTQSNRSAGPGTHNAIARSYSTPM